MNLNDFKKGQKVRYIGNAHLRHGAIGTVVRPVKSRQVVTLIWDDVKHAPWFDARPENLELITGQRLTPVRRDWSKGEAV